MNHESISLIFLLIICIGLEGDGVYAQTSGQSTRYWDCCKPSCSWVGKASYKNGPVQTCNAQGQVIPDLDTQSGCDNTNGTYGTAYSCANNQPWVVSDQLSYGFAAAAIAGQQESQWCCACYELTFTSGPVSGKKLVVQVTNTGGDLGQNHFDLQIPGGGVGIYNGCTGQYGAPPDGWGSRYGGVSSRDECSQLPGELQAGCQWRFDWFQNADNPAHQFRRVSCPAEITSKTGCVRTDE